MAIQSGTVENLVTTPANAVVHEDIEHIRAQAGQTAHFQDAGILITGAAGFLGFYFCHYFHSLLAGNTGPRKIILLDKFLFGRPAWLDALASADSRIHVQEFDIATGALEDVPGAREANYVLHMASIASPVFYRLHPLETLDANIWGLRRLLDFYRGSALRGLLFFSSSEIYGDPPPDRIPTSEDYRGNVSCLGPRACYDEAKRFGETLCEVYATKYGVPVRMVRPFNNYGPGMSLNDQRVPADFARSVLKGQDLVMLSSGTPTRTFCYVADAIAGYLKMLLYDRFDVVNIGIDRPEIPVTRLAEIYREAGTKVMGYRGQIVRKSSSDRDYLTNNPERRCPDISKARRLLSFQPSILVEAGVERFLRFLWLEKQNPASA